MTYRSPSAPVESTSFVQLRPHRARRVVLAPCLWFLGFWFLIWPVAWVVQAVVAGEGLWKLAFSPLWLAVPWVVTRTMRMETVLLGTRTIRRVGFLRDHVMEWSAIESVRRFERRRSRGRAVRLLGLRGGGRELVVAPDVVEDRNGTLDWAVERVTRGNASEIDERVRTEGSELSRARWYVPHVVTAIVLSLAVGWVITGDQRRRVVERELRGLDGLPAEERVERARAVFDDEGVENRLRCRAGTIITYSLAHRGDLEAGLDSCRQMANLVCTVMPRCVEIEALRDARDALSGGDAARALTLLEGASRGVVRAATEVASLRSLGRDASEQAERCWRVYGQSDDPVVRELARPCSPR